MGQSKEKMWRGENSLYVFSIFWNFFNYPLRCIKSPNEFYCHLSSLTVSNPAKSLFRIVSLYFDEALMHLWQGH